MNVVILAGVCLVAQVLLTMGWLSTASALRTWATTIQGGWSKEGVDTLKEHMPLMSNAVQQNVVYWKGVPHLKASAVWLTQSKIEEERGSSLSLLHGLLGRSYWRRFLNCHYQIYRVLDFHDFAWNGVYIIRSGDVCQPASEQ